MELSRKDKRAAKFGAVCAVSILVFMLLTTWFEHWGRVRRSVALAEAQLEVIRPSKAKQEGLLSIVPVFEMPQGEEQQRFLFREKFNEQLKKAGIKCKPLKIHSTARSRHKSGYKLLLLECRGKAKFEQVLDLLAGLKENPYLAGIEEFKIRCDPKKRQEFELNLTVSTFTE